MNSFALPRSEKKTLREEARGRGAPPRARNLPEVRRYIENQREHHGKMTFEDELRVLLTRHSIEFDERYVWD